MKLKDVLSELRNITCDHLYHNITQGYSFSHGLSRLTYGEVGCVRTYKCGGYVSLSFPKRFNLINIRGKVGDDEVLVQILGKLPTISTKYGPYNPNKERTIVDIGFNYYTEDSPTVEVVSEPLDYSSAMARDFSMCQRHLTYHNILLPRMTKINQQMVISAGSGLDKIMHAHHISYNPSLCMDVAMSPWISAALGFGLCYISAGLSGLVGNGVHPQSMLKLLRDATPSHNEFRTVYDLLDNLKRYSSHVNLYNLHHDDVNNFMNLVKYAQLCISWEEYDEENGLHSMEDDDDGGSIFTASTVADVNFEPPQFVVLQDDCLDPC